MCQMPQRKRRDSPVTGPRGTHILTCQFVLTSLNGSSHSANLGSPPAGPACAF